MNENQQTPADFSEEGLAIVARVKEIMDANKSETFKTLDERLARHIEANEAALRSAIATVAAGGAQAVDLKGLIRDELKTVAQPQGTNILNALLTSPEGGKLLAANVAGHAAMLAEPPFLVRMGVTKGYEPAKRTVSSAQARIGIAASLPGLLEAARASGGAEGEVLALAMAGLVSAGLREADRVGFAKPETGLPKWAAVGLGILGGGVAVAGVTVGVMAVTKTGFFKEQDKKIIDAVVIPT